MKKAFLVVTKTVVGGAVVTVTLLGTLLLLTPYSRDSCLKSARICGAGNAATVEFGGIAGSGSCSVVCGDGPGEVVLIDRSWPFGPQRD